MTKNTSLFQACLTLLLLLTGAFYTGGSQALHSAELRPFTGTQIEFHGRYNNNDFWMRLLPADKRYGGGRILELLYTPYAKDRFAGAIMVDHPQILVDTKLRIQAWKEGRGPHQTGFGNVMYRGDQKPFRYVITRETEDSEGEAVADERAIPGAAGCDLHILPILIACAYAKGVEADARVVDLFGGRYRENMTAKLRAGGYSIGDSKWVITADANGYVKTIKDQNGKEILSITKFLKK